MPSTAEILRRVFEVGGIGLETFGRVKLAEENKQSKADDREKELNRIDRERHEEIQAREGKIVGGRIKARAKVASTERTLQNQIRLAEAKDKIKRRSEKLKKQGEKPDQDERFDLWLQGKLKAATPQEQRFFDNQLEGRGKGKATKDRDLVKEARTGFDKQLDARSKVLREAKTRGTNLDESLEQAGQTIQTGTIVDYYNSQIRPTVSDPRAADSVGALLGDEASVDRFAVRRQAGDSAPIGPRQAAGPTQSLGSEIEQVQGDQQDGAPRVIDITPFVDPDALTLDEERLFVLLQKERDQLATEEEILELIRLIQLTRNEQSPFPAPQ